MFTCFDVLHSCLISSVINWLRLWCSDSGLTGDCFVYLKKESLKEHLFSSLRNNVTVYQYVGNVLANFKINSSL